MTDRLSVLLLLSGVLRILGLQPALELFDAHVDILIELLNDLIVAFDHFGYSALEIASVARYQAVDGLSAPVRCSEKGFEVENR